MFDIGWTEMVVIVILAIIVIGPKDLPKVLRALGRWIRKARMAAREFQSSLDEALRETGLDEVKNEIDAAARFDPRRAVEKAIDPGGEIGAALRPDETGRGETGPGETGPGGSGEAGDGPASPPGGGKPRPGA